MTPVEFLHARLDEFEAKARGGRRLRLDVAHFEKRQGVPGRLAQYRLDPHEPWRWLTPEVESGLFEPTEPDPSVLADVAVKRAIIAEHSPITVYSDSRRLDSARVCKTCGGSDAYYEQSGRPAMRMAAYPCRTLRLLAQAFAEHPDFDPAWRA